MTPRTQRRWTGGALLVPLLALTACGGSPTAPTEQPEASGDAGGVQSVLADYAALPDGERLAELTAKAQEEGELTVYTSNTDMQDIADAFGDAYDVDVSVYRANNETVIQRLLQEDQAGYHSVDALELDGPSLDIAVSEDLLAPYGTPLREDISGVKKLPDNWTPDRLNAFVVAWNTDKVPSGSEPASFEDLADPEWKGRLAMELGDYDWLLGLHDYFVGDQGWTEDHFSEVMQGIAANAKVVKGHTVMGELLSAGEFDVALDDYSHTIDQAIAAGAPVAWHRADGSAVEPVAVRANGVGVMQLAPHPAAAALFAEFLLTEGQKLLVEKTRVPAIPPPGAPDALEGVETSDIPTEELRTNSEEWSKRYEALIENSEQVS